VRHGSAADARLLQIGAAQEYIRTYAYTLCTCQVLSTAYAPSARRLSNLAWLDGTGRAIRLGPRRVLRLPAPQIQDHIRLRLRTVVRPEQHLVSLAYESCTTHSSLPYSSPQTTPHTLRIMSVLLETSAGDITIDLLVKDAPKCCEK